MATDEELVFLPLGGCGEVGANLSLYGYGSPGKHRWIIVDLGVTFGDDTTPGIDLILPDPTFIAERRDKLLGIVLTHAHEDHIGAVAHLWPQLECPIYATPFTAILVREKLAEKGLQEIVPLHIVPLKSTIELGPFKIELVTMTHSTLEPNCLAIDTPHGRVIHTGDWKLDETPTIGPTTDEATLRKFGEEGVLAMVCDSTNVFTPGMSGSEDDVKRSLTELIGELKGKVAVTTFASNVQRLHSVAKAARHNGREVCLVGRSMHRIVGAAREAGYLTDFPTPVSEDEAGYLPADKILYLCTGSQGEERAALARIAEDNHPHVVMGEGDSVIFSSRIIPGNETKIFDLQNRLAENGVRIITEHDHFVHVSGHPCREELATLYSWVRPKIAVPVHGEVRHLYEHRALAKSLQTPEAVVAHNGEMLRLAPGPAQITKQVDHGKLFLDGNVLISESDGAVRERKKLAFHGVITVTCVFDRNGDLAADPGLSGAGLPSALDIPGESLLDAIEDQVGKAIDGLDKRRAKDDAAVEETVRRTVRRMLRDPWGKKPLIDLQIIRL